MADNTMNASGLLTGMNSSLEEISKQCRARDFTIAVAESVTAGSLQLALSNAPVAQGFYQGGITVYNCAQKAIHLNIEPIYATSCNAVDPAIAEKMAREVCKMFRAQIGVAVTGYASKVPEDDINELYAFVAISKDDEILVQERLEPQGEGEGISAQWDYTTQIIYLLLKTLPRS